MVSLKDFEIRRVLVSFKVYVADITFVPLAPDLKAVQCPADFELRPLSWTQLFWFLFNAEATVKKTKNLVGCRGWF